MLSAYSTQGSVRRSGVDYGSSPRRLCWYVAGDTSAASPVTTGVQAVIGVGANLCTQMSLPTTVVLVVPLLTFSGIFKGGGGLLGNWKVPSAPSRRRPPLGAESAFGDWKIPKASSRRFLTSSDLLAPSWSPTSH